MKKIFVLIILTAAFGAMPVQELFVFAAEEGTGHYVPGSLADFGDMAPPSGLAFLDWYNHYSGSAGVSKTVPVAGFITANLNTKSNAEALGAMYTLPCSVLEGRYSAGLIAPYVFMNVTGTVTGPLGKTITRTDTTSGIGDITLIPFWLSGQTAISDGGCNSMSTPQPVTTKPANWPMSVSIIGLSNHWCRSAIWARKRDSK